MHFIHPFYSLFLDVCMLFFVGLLGFILYKRSLYPFAPRYSLHVIGSFFIVWLGFAYFLSRTDVTASLAFPVGPSMLLFAILGSIGLYVFNNTFRKFIHDTPVYLLIIPIVVRIGGLVFVGVAQEGLMGNLFALPLGWGDVLIGGLSPLMAYVSYKQVTHWKTYLSIWNWSGILVFVFIILVAVIATPPFQIIHPVPNFELRKYFPLSATAFIVLPLTTIFHILIFLKLRKQ